MTTKTPKTLADFKQALAKRKKIHDSILDKRYEDMEGFDDETELEKQNRIMDTPSAWQS